MRLAIRRIKSLGVAVSTSACANGSIPVWTRESCVDGEFLNSMAKSTPEIFRICVEPPFMPPGINHGAKVNKKIPPDGCAGRDEY